MCNYRWRADLWLNYQKIFLLCPSLSLLWYRLVLGSPFCLAVAEIGAPCLESIWLDLIFSPHLSLCVSCVAFPSKPMLGLTPATGWTHPVRWILILVYSCSLWISAFYGILDLFRDIMYTLAVNRSHLKHFGFNLRNWLIDWLIGEADRHMSSWRLGTKSLTSHQLASQDTHE